MKSAIIFFRLLLPFLLLSWSSSLAFAELPKRTQALKVGMILPLSGDFAFFGYQAMLGATLAANEINSAAKLNKSDGERIEILFEDSKCLPKDAVGAYRKLLNLEKVDVIIGPACTGAIMAIAPLATRARKPIFALLDAGEQVSKAGDQVYSLGFSSEEEGYLVAAHLHQKNITDVGIIFEDDQWATLVKDAFKRRFTSLGGAVLVEESHNPQDKDYRPTILKVVKHKPKALYIVPAYNGGHILKQLKELRVSIPVFGPDTFGATDVLKIAKRSAEGVVYANVLLNENNEATMQLRKKYLAQFAESPESLLFPALGYDAVVMVNQALSSSISLADGLSSLKYPLAVLPVEGFDEQGMARLTPQLMKIVKQKFVPLAK